MTSVRSNTGVYDHASSEEKTYLSWVGVDLQISEDTSGRVITGVNPLNLVEAP